MKVAVISHAYQEERYLKALEAMAQSPDVEITLIHPETYKGKQYRWNNSHSITDVAVPIVFGSRQGAFLYHLPKLAKALAKLRPDLILHEQETYTLGALEVATIAWWQSIPFVQFVWENVDRTFCLPRRLLRRYVLSRAGAMIAGSEGAKLVHAELGYTRPIEVMPQMGVHATLSPRLGKHCTTTLHVCFIGRLETCKGVDCLLQAVSLLHRRGFDTAVAVAGDGPERARLAALARELGIWALVHFRGQLRDKEVKKLLRSSDVLVLPSRRTRDWQEQFGLVLAEAMAEATVTVGSRTGAIPEVIGCDDLLFQEGDPEALAEVLQHLHSHGDFYLRSQFNLWQRVQDRFTADTIAERKVNFLQRVLTKADETGTDPVDFRPELTVRAR